LQVTLNGAETAVPVPAHLTDNTVEAVDCLNPHKKLTV